MPGKVLVAYVTKTGSTREAAEAVAEALREGGREVEVRPISEAGPVREYGAVVVGAPINGMAWHPAATAFVRSAAGELAGRPSAYFLVSYMLETGRPVFRRAIRKALDPAIAAARPVAVGMFQGRITSELPPIARALFGVAKGVPLDLTDLSAVRAWAAEIAGKLA